MFQDIKQEKSIRIFQRNATISRSSQKLKKVYIALVCIWLGLVTYILLESLAGLLTLDNYIYQPWSMIRLYSINNWAPWVILTPITFFLAEKIIISPQHWYKPVFIHFWLMLLLSTLHGFFISVIFHYTAEMDAEMATYAFWQHTGHFLFTDTNMFLFDSFTYVILIASSNINNFYDQIKKKEIETYKVNEQLSEARLRMLKMQINPHFLFNTLNSISVLVKKNENAKADIMLHRLSDFFRETLISKGQMWVPLKKEIEVVKQYLDIEKVRIGDRLSIKYEIDEDAEKYDVPIMITQPLVENAIKHGIGKKTGKCELAIGAKIVGNRLRIRISDTGVGHEFEKGEVQNAGIGIQNVRARLKEMCGNDAGLRLEGIGGTGVVARLEIPIINKNNKRSPE